MDTTIIWQQNISKPENADNLAKIGQWWANIKDKEVIWQQRLIPENGNLKDIDWEFQGFDAKFKLLMSQLRGITLYWQKPDLKQELNITPSKLVLDLSKQQLDLYPQSQPQVVIRVSIPTISYQTIELTNPQIASTLVGENYLLLLRDRQQQLEVKVTLNRETLVKLLKI
jgi:hypothetical protein